ncbi:MAG: sulfite exporter TauE/SafE family protein [Alphaproteobacteria bacterium]|nr:sulfite exporter TauE/SafE family protein [Alphaproteobacteria bacterium]
MDLLNTVLPDVISPLWALTLISISFLTSLLTATMGIGGGLMLVAVMASVMPPLALIPVHGVVQLGSNAGRAYLFRQHVRRAILGWFAVGAIVGVSIGGMLAVQMPRELLLILIASFILFSTWAPKLSTLKVPDKGFLAVGMGTAFVTMFVGATGPFLAPFVSPERLGGKQATLGTFAACMCLKHTLKSITFAVIGFAFLEWMPLIVAMIVTGFLGTLVGKAIVLRLPERMFQIGFKIVLTLLALRMLWQAAGTWLQ